MPAVARPQLGRNGVLQGKKTECRWNGLRFQEDQGQDSRLPRSRQLQQAAAVQSDGREHRPLDRRADSRMLQGDGAGERGQRRQSMSQTPTKTRRAHYEGKRNFLLDSGRGPLYRHSRRSSFALQDAIFAAISAIRSTSPTKTSPKRRSCVKSPIFRPRTS